MRENSDILPSKTWALYTFRVLHVLRNHLSNQSFKTVQNGIHEHGYIFNLLYNILKQNVCLQSCWTLNVIYTSHVLLKY
jgi:hypothetical protein